MKNTMKWKKFLLPTNNTILWIHGKNAYLVSPNEPTEKIPYETTLTTLKIHEKQDITHSNTHSERKIEEKLDLTFYNVCPRSMKKPNYSITGHNIIKLTNFLNSHYRKMNVLWLPEIHWICLEGKRQIIIPQGNKKLKNIIQENDKYSYLIIPLSIHSKDICVLDESKLEPSSHENILFINKKKKQIERFDPNFIDTDYESLQLDAQMYQIAQSMKYNYISPFDDLPEHGLQCLQGDDSNDCVAWSYAWSEMRIRYPDLPREELFERFLFTLLSENNEKNKNISKLLNEYIKHYIMCLFNHIQK